MFPTRRRGLWANAAQQFLSNTIHFSRSQAPPPKWRRSDIRPPGATIPVLSGCRPGLAQLCLSRDLKTKYSRTPRPPKAVRVGTCAWLPRAPPSVPPFGSRPLGPAPRPASALLDVNVGVSARSATSRRASDGDCVSVSGPQFSSPLPRLPQDLQSFQTQ